jgi:muramoyltetrapeptide carboxypeptidase
MVPHVRERFERPSALKPGDRVAVVAPSSPFPREPFERGLARLAQRYRPVMDPGIGSAERYLAGSDDRRLAELSRALGDAEVAAVFCARGGFGAMRLLRRLRLPDRPVVLVGFSDITALHAAFQRAGRVSVHGPVVTQLGRLDEPAVRHLFALLEDPGARPCLRGTPVVPGRAEGPVVGGNLSVLTRLLGTPFWPDLDGAILFFEDVGEPPYRLDRMWQHLDLSGALDRVAGVAMGTFVDCDDPEGRWGAAEVLGELAARRGLPCVLGLPAGHGDVHLSFPLGARAVLDGGAGTLEFTEGAVS